MKSKIFLFNKAVFKRNITGGWCLWAGLLLFYLLLLPVSVYGSLAEIAKYNAASDNLLGMIRHTVVTKLWNLETLVPFFAMAALFCAMFVFSYLFTGRNSNMMHTYPVSRVSLFVTNFVTGLAFLLVPVILSALLTLAAGAAYGAVNGNIVKYTLIWIVTAVVENFFFFSMAVCVLMFVGNIIAVPALYLILNFLYGGCILIAETMLSTVCYGLESFVLTRSKLGVLTPIVYLMRVGAGTSEHITFDGSDIEMRFIHMNALFGYFAAAVLFAVIALAAYQKKHIETAGDVITVKWLKPIFRWGAAVCTSSLGALLISDTFYTKSFAAILLSVAVIGIIVFFIAQMLLERSMHVFSKKKICECMIYTGIVCACYIALELDVTGLETKIPSVDQIQAVRMRGSIDLIAVDEEDISWVQDIHSQIVSSRKEFKRILNDRNETTEYLSIEYLLKDDSILRRSYEVPLSKEEGSVLKQVQDYACQPEVILKQYFGIHYPDVDIYGGSWYIHTDEGEESGRVSETQAKQLYEAVVSDVQRGNVSGNMDGSADSSLLYVGDLLLDVRDEKGFFNQISTKSLQSLCSGDLDKDGDAYININEKFTCLLEKLHEIGCLSDEQYDSIINK